jgi:hypothetical protein
MAYIRELIDDLFVRNLLIKLMGCGGSKASVNAVSPDKSPSSA